MKKTIIAGFVFSAILLTTASTNAGAQTIYVKIRPAAPVIVRPVAPGPHYVWIAEEWTPRGSGYAYAGGYWAPPPHPGWVWIPGHWKRHHHDEYWVAGHWGR